MSRLNVIRKIVRDDYFSKDHWIETFHGTVRNFPLLASLVAPLSVLYDIPALTQPWYGFENQALTDEKTSLILSSFSLFFNVVANLCLLLRFSIASRRGYTIATRLSMVFWVLKASIALVNLIIFGVYKNNDPGYEYLEGFWCAVLSCILSCFSALILFAHYLYEFDPHVALRNNEVRLRGRGFMLNVTLMMVQLGIFALVFSRIEHWTYLDGIYFSTVSVLTVGFGDFSPTTTAGKILLFPFVLIGIAQLAVVVSQIIDFFSQRSLEIMQVTRHHIEKERLRKEMAMDTIDLNQELLLLEKTQKEEDNREELINLTYSLLAFFALWFLGALIFSKLEGWTYGNGLYFSYVFFLTLGYGDYSPSSSAGRVVFILYALIAVPVMTSFAVQSITKAMSLLSEQGIVRQSNKLHRWPDPVPHHTLLDEAQADLAQLTHRKKLEHLLVDSVLQMDLATRKLLSVTLEGHPKLLLKADTIVQLRNTDYEYEEFVEQFHNVQTSKELANYRKKFAEFLISASAMLELEGEEERLFQRRVKEEDAAANGTTRPKNERLRRSYDLSSSRSSTATDPASMPMSAGKKKQDELEFHMGQHPRRSTDEPVHEEKSPDEVEDDEPYSRPYDRHPRTGRQNALQTQGLNDNHQQSEQADEERDV